MQLPIKICTTYATTVRRSHICLTTREVKYHDVVASNTNELEGPSISLISSRVAENKAAAEKAGELAGRSVNDQCRPTCRRCRSLSEIVPPQITTRKQDICPLGHLPPPYSTLTLT